MIEVINAQDQKRLAATLERIRERNVVLDADLMSEVGTIVEAVRRGGRPLGIESPLGVATPGRSVDEEPVYVVREIGILVVESSDVGVNLVAKGSNGNRGLRR